MTKLVVLITTHVEKTLARPLGGLAKARARPA